MLLSSVSFLVVVQSSSEVPEGLMNNPIFMTCLKCLMSPSVDADFLQQPFLFHILQKHCFKKVAYIFEDLLTYIISRLSIYLSWVESSLKHNSATEVHLFIVHRILVHLCRIF